MSSNVVQVSADGLARFDAFTRIAREEADALASAGVEYEEMDRRADPGSSLIVTIIVAMLTAAATKIIERMIDGLFEEEAKQPLPAPAPTQTTVNIIVVVNGSKFTLASDKAAILDAVRKSQAPDAPAAS